MNMFFAQEWLKMMLKTSFKWAEPDVEMTTYLHLTHMVCTVPGFLIYMSTSQQV